MVSGELLLIAGALGSHSNFSERGYRQKDVRFLAELFANWLVENPMSSKPMVIHNTQAQRFVDNLVESGHSRQINKSYPPRYVLTRMGILDLVTRLSSSENLMDFESFLFVFYFLRTYSERLKHLISREGSGFPKSLQIEIEALLSYQSIKEKKAKELELEIKRCKVRLEETVSSVAMSEKLKRQGASVDSIITQVANAYPYELNAQKPMADLLKEIPPELRLWELIDGNRSRADLIFTPLLSRLENFYSILKALP